jgi:Uncharacterized protein conserved in bacteria
MTSDASHVRRFRRLADAYLAETHERFPEHASRLGLEKFNARLGVNDTGAHRAQIRLAETTLAEVESQPEAAFRGDDWLDRRLFLALLRTELLNDRDLQRWRTNPQGPCDTAVDAIFDLVVRHTDNLPRILPAIEARLEKIPDYLEAGAENIRFPVPLWTKLARRSCEGAVSFLRDVEPELAGASKNPVRVRSAIAGAIRAFERYADAISRKKPGPVRGYAIGRERFELLMRERLGFDISLPEARANGERLVRQLTVQLEEEARRLGGRSARTLLESAAESWTPERPLLDEYRNVTLVLKRRLRAMGLVTLPKGESLQVLPAPPFLRHQFPTAAYNAPPPFSKKQEGIFWVNDLSLGIADGAKRLAEIRQHFGLELTSVHEGYPGHHLQFAVQNRHPSKLRRLANHSIYYEGWTMWCEHMAVERGLAEGRFVRLQQIHDALWRAYRIIIDCGLHDGTLDYNGACRVLMDGVGFTRARAAGDVNWYTSSPTIPMSYLLGRLEVEKLYQRFVIRGSWSLKKFNDWMLSHGALPWSWIVKAYDAA